MSSPIPVSLLRAKVIKRKQKMAIYSGIKLLQEGNEAQLKSENDPFFLPKIVAFAIKQSIPIPLKYTHSYQGLKELYFYSIYFQDIRLYSWTVDQIRLTLSPTALKEFNDEIPPDTQLPVPKNTLSRQFLMTLQDPNVNINQIASIQKRCPPGSFWESQINRLISINQAFWEFRPHEKNTFRSTFQLLEFSFLNAPKLSHTKLLPKTLIDQYGIKEAVSVPALIQSYAQKQEWIELTKNPLFKKAPFDPMTIYEKLKAWHAPPQLLAQIKEKIKK